MSALKVGCFVEFELAPHPDSPLPQGGVVRGVVDYLPDSRFPGNPSIYVKGLGRFEVLRSKLRVVPCLFAGDSSQGGES